MSEKNVLNHSRTIEYLAGSLVSKKTDRNGRGITFTYDSFDRPTDEKWYDTAGTPQRTITTSYDTVGNVLSVSDPSGTFTYTYDNFGRVTQEAMTLDGLAPQVVFDSTYDMGSRLTQSAVTVGSTKDYVETFEYDANGQITSLIQQGQTGGHSVASKRMDYSYNASGQKTNEKVYASTSTSSIIRETLFSYDGMGRLTDLTHKNGTTTYADYADYDLSWDAASRITDFDFTYRGGGNHDTTYTYDDTDQLTAATYSRYPNDESFTYDANGNRTNNSFTVGPNNRLAYDGTFTYTYDNEGNRLVKMMLPDIVVTSYSWDQRNRLANAGTVNYRYDYLNRLVSRTGDIFVHDGYQIVLQFTNGVLSHRYFWGANQDELVADEPATSSSTPSTQTLWALCDHLGSVRDLLRLNGTTPVVANHLTYNAFGSRVGYTSMAAADMPLFRYTGKMTDDTTQLQWNINRWYDANAGKWISEDPIGFRGNDANLYRYVENTPTIFRDIFGKSRNIFISAFNSAVIKATQREIKGKPNVPAYFMRVFNIHAILLKLGDNLFNKSIKYKKVDKVSGRAVAKYYYLLNTFEFTENISGNVAVHESAHAYNDLKLGIWSADYDEALAYMIQGMVQPGFTRAFKRWEEALDGNCPADDHEAKRNFENQWSNIWDVPIQALTGIMVSLGGDSAGRPVTEKDYQNLKKSYGIHVSCEEYKKWSLKKIKTNWENQCDTECFVLECPDSLWSIFK